MTKNKHPADRAERLRLKREKKRITQEEHASRVRKRLAREEIKDDETLDELKGSSIL